MVKIYESLAVHFAIVVIGILVIGMFIFTLGEWALKNIDRALDKKINSVLDLL